jgi:hypothetical protein
MNTALATIPEEYQEMQREALTFADHARLIEIHDDESYEIAGDTLVSIKGYLKRIDERLEPGKKKAYTAYQEWIDLIKEAKKPYLEAELYLKKAIADYAAEQEKLRKEEEARLRELARKKEEELRLAEALAAEMDGDVEEAAAILDEPVYVPPPVVQNTTPKVNGISMATTWKFRIVDEAKIPRQFLTPDMVKISGVVRAMKDATNIPGIEVYAEQTIRAGASRR